MSLGFSHTQNRILAALPDEELGKLLPYLVAVELRRGDVLAVENDPVHHIYFPQHGLVSLLITMSDGTSADATTVGPEGFAGLGAVLGRGRYYTRNVMQVTGAASRITSQQFLETMSECPALRRIINLYLGAFIAQTLRNAACNALHSIEARTARWLLIAQDSVRRDHFDLSQGFLAEMVGCRRASINSATRSFQSSGFITYSPRGAITIRHRSGIEAMACECYQDMCGIWEEVFVGER